MIETKNPEINVDELMKRIRAEVAGRKGRGQNASVPSEYKTSQSSLPFENHVIPRLHLSSLSLREPFSLRNDGSYQINDFLIYHNEEFIKNAYQGILGRAADPVGLDLYLNRLGGGVSKIEILGRLRYCSEGRKKGNKIRGLFFPLVAQMLFKIPALGYFIRLGIAVFRLPRALHDIIDYTDYSISKNEIIQNHLNQNFNGIEKSYNQLTEVLHAKTSTIEGLRMSLESSEQGLSKLDNRITGLEESMNQSLAERDNLIEGLEKPISYLKTSLVLQERRLSMLLEEARKRLPEPFNHDQLHTFANEELHLLDPLYVSFEDEFRGTREDIKDRLKVYLPLIKEAKAGNDKRPILDIGCGRGEWLELLQEEGLQAKGLDINPILVEQCRERRMDVIEGDVIEYLCTLSAASLGAVTAFHLIEHLSFRLLMKLLDETVRVLKPGGLAIFETPNPENILVGACSFYLDPTHRNPLPPAMMKFLADSRGLCRVEIKHLHPYDEVFRIRDDGSDLAKRFNDFFYGPQDYAVLGYRI